MASAIAEASEGGGAHLFGEELIVLFVPPLFGRFKLYNLFLTEHAST